MYLFEIVGTLCHSMDATSLTCIAWSTLVFGFWRSRWPSRLRLCDLGLPQTSIAAVRAFFGNLFSVLDCFQNRKPCLKMETVRLATGFKNKIIRKQKRIKHEIWK
jgi:hypothetical protein